MRLNLKQTRAIDYLEDNITTELEYGGGAGGGKSMLGCYWQTKRRLKYPGTRGLIGRASLKTLKETTLQSFFEVCTMQGLKVGTHYRYNQQSNIITFANGSLIFLKDLFQYPSDPNFDELGSLEITDAFIDENNQVVEKGWNIVKSRIRYKLDDYGLIPKMLGCCNPDKGYVYRRFYKPSKDGSLPPDRQFIQALVSDNPDISEHYRKNLLGLDENSKQRLLYGNWEYDNDPATLIEYEKILDCFTNSFVPTGESFITCDVARFGSDSSVIGLWNGLRVKLYQFKGLALTVLSEKIKALAELNNVPLSRIIADEDGVGGGVVDILRCKGFVNNSTALENPIAPLRDDKGNAKPENFTNLKSQCYFKLAEFVNAGKIFIECDDIEIKSKIIQELEQVKQHNMDKDGKKSVLPKDKVIEIIGRSPDFSDTLMMRMYFTLKPVRQFADADY
jgi:phage terminase large subunit